MDSRNVGWLTLSSIQKLQGNNGISLLELKKFLRDEKKINVDQFNTDIELALKSFMDRDILSRDGGLYKIKLSKCRGKGRSKGGKSGEGKKLSGSKRRRRKKASPSGE